MQLHAAASRGDLEGIAFALKVGSDVNSRNSAGQTALVFALDRAKAFSRQCGPKVTLEVVEALLDAGADLEATDGLATTAIHHAVGIPDPEFLCLLLERGGNPRHITKSGYSVLLHACFQPASQAKRVIVERLHQAGASLDVASGYGEFPLGECLRFGDFEALRYLIELGADSGPLNWSELHHAVALKEQADIERLSPSDTDINNPNPRFGLSPWLLAFIRGDLATIRYLADQGADLTQMGRGGESLLHLAAEFGHENAINWLLDLGADTNIGGASGETPLHRAAEQNRVASAKALLGRGADASTQSHFQSQPIHSAHSAEMVQLLAEFGGADLNAVDGCGEWPLKSAAENNDVERITWLLNHGAKVDRTSTGDTALHSAVLFDSREAVDALLEAGANPNAQDVDGWTPFSTSASWDDAQEFIARLNEDEDGPDYRLPTEAEWEYFARAGTTTRHYFGDDSSQLGQHAWYGEGFGEGGHHPVAQKTQNPWGLYDIHGNVWEWVQDWYGADYYVESPAADPRGPDAGDERVVRGGSWHSTGDGWRSASRRDYEADYRGISIGFRLVRNVRDERERP